MKRSGSFVQARQINSWGGEAFEGLEPLGEVVGGDKVRQMTAQLVVSFVVEAFDRGLFDRALHALDLTVGPRVFGLGQAVVDAGKGAGVFEGMCSKRLLFVRSSA